ncbi:MAG: hypothetical protein WC654_08035 [Patescibacteria group bacterium]
MPEHSFPKLNTYQTNLMDEVIRSIFNTELTFREYYEQNPSFRQIYAKMKEAKEQALHLAKTDAPAAVKQLATTMRRLATEVEGEGVDWQWKK